MQRRRRNGGLPRPKGYLCEWACGKAFRDGSDYVAHVIAKHENGAQPLPAESFWNVIAEQAAQIRAQAR